MLIFEITDEEHKIIKEWFQKIKPKILKAQKKLFKGHSYSLDMIADGEPYYGTSGGGLTYIFNATAIGSFISVRESSTGLELDVSKENGYKNI